MLQSENVYSCISLFHTDLKKLGKNLYATFSSVYYFQFFMRKYNMYGSFY